MVCRGVPGGANRPTTADGAEHRAGRKDPGGFSQAGQRPLAYDPFTAGKVLEYSLSENFLSPGVLEL